MSTFLKYAPIVAVVINTLGAALSPAVMAFWASHPALASLLTGVALFLPQPHK